MKSSDLSRVDIFCRGPSVSPIYILALPIQPSYLSAIGNVLPFLAENRNVEVLFGKEEYKLNHHRNYCFIARTYRNATKSFMTASKGEDGRCLISACLGDNGSSEARNVLT